jgi:protein-tyrosine phosphatase
VIDLHCHLLPGIDDGPPGLEDSVALARAFLAAGVTRVAATPHVSPAHPNTAAGIHAAWLDLVGALARERVPLQVVAGAELDLLHASALPDEELAALTLGRDAALLVECPFSPVAARFEELVARLQDKGFRVVLAHPERSPAFQRDPELLRRLVRRGALASLTASALTGAFGRTARRYARWALDEELAHDVASDAHDLVRRPPGLRPALEQEGYERLTGWLTDEVPDAVLSGEPIPQRPALRAGGGWSALRRMRSGGAAT